MEVVAVESATLDGVMQAPGRPDEDERGGFAHGGWAVPYNDPVMGRAMGERMARGGALLLGRRTYEDLYGYWPKQPPNPFTEKLTRTTKYVASTTLRGPLPWEHSVPLGGDAVDAVRRMKGDDEDLGIIGSGALVRSSWPNFCVGFAVASRIAGTCVVFTSSRLAGLPASMNAPCPRANRVAASCSPRPL
jgi:dihydrofolate reductase